MRAIHKDRKWPNITRTREEYMNAPSDLIIGTGFDRDEYQSQSVSKSRCYYSCVNRLDLQAGYRASYYIWCVRRGHTCAGNDPITGRKRSDKAESRAAHIALAKFWLSKAYGLRLKYRQYYSPFK